jgi:glucose-1-phosphate adenylyltransferase
MPAALTPDLSDTFTVLLAGGQGSRLHELTSRECKPALPFAGNRRIVDFTMANAVRSGLTRMIVATQYRPETLAQHLATRWAPSFTRLDIREGRKVTGRPEGYAGTAAAVTANLAEIEASGAREIVVLAGDHVYEMDYAAMVASHRASGAEVTVAVDTVDIAEAHAFGVVLADEQGCIRSFIEKPKHAPQNPLLPGKVMVSMGIYVFSRDWLLQALREDAATASSHDFGHDILPRAVAQGVAFAHRAPAQEGAFYWRDVGTLDAYRTAQLEFLQAEPPCALPERRMPSQNELSAATGDLIQFAYQMQAGGLSLRAPRWNGGETGRWTLLDETVVMPGARLAPGVRLTKAIVAPGTSVPEGLVVGEDPEEDARWFRRTEGGTTLITTAMLARRGADRRKPIFAPHINAFLGRSA